ADAIDASGESGASVRAAIRTLLLLLHPIAPHITEEWWERLGGKGLILQTAWPDFDRDLATTTRVTLVVQVNGKVRGRLDMVRGVKKEEALSLPRADERIRPWLEGKRLTRAVYVADRLLNLVVQ